MGTEKMNIGKIKKEIGIGIVGGAGRMGLWAFDLFKGLGYSKLNMYDTKATTQEEADKRRVTNHNSLDSLVESCDIVIVSIPPKATVEVINKIGPLMTEEKLFSDFTSIKEESCRAMAEYLSEAIGIHPMFSNTVKDLHGQNIILTPVKGKSETWLPRLEEMFGETPAHIRIVSPDAHDKIVSYNQAGIHLSFLVLGGVLKDVCREYGFEPEEIYALSTPNSKALDIFLGRFFGADNPAVYFGIQGQTEYAKKIRRMFADEIKVLSEMLDKGDTESFRGYYHHIRSKIGKVNLEIASEDSNKVVALLKELGNQNRIRQYHKDTAEHIEDKIFTPLSETNAVALYNDKRPTFADNQCGHEITVPERHLAVLVEKYITINFQFKDSNYKKSKEAAVEMRHYLGKNILKNIRKMPELKPYEEKLQLLHESLTEYIGRAERLINYSKHTKER